MEPVTDKSQPRGETARDSRRVLQLYRTLAQASLGDELDRIVLFGSRARGDHRAESDWDVAVFLRHPITSSDQRCVSAIGHDVMCATGALIQSVALPAERWEAHDEFTRHIRRDGVPIHDDAAESLSVARRFAGLALKNQPEDFEVVIHAAYYAMHHGARAALLGARGSASTNHGQVLSAFAALAKQRDGTRGPEYSRAPSAAYDLRTLSDYGRAGRDLTGDAAALQQQLREFLDYCAELAAG